jgi:hypothetical protein
MAFDQAKFTAQIQAVAKYFKESLIDFGRETSTNNVIDLTRAIEIVANEGDFAALLASRTRTARSRYASAVSGATIKSLMDPIFQSYLRNVMLVPPEEIGDVSSSWPRIVEHFLFSAPGVARVPIFSVQSRGITRGTSPASSSGTGDGVVHRLTVDRYGVTVEGSPVPFNIDFECTQDETGGADPGEETFAMSGPGATDILDEGSGVGFDPTKTIASLNSDGEFLSDASFQLTNTAAGVPDPTDIGSWIDPTGLYGTAKYAIVSTNTFMSSVEEDENGQALALQVKGNHKLQQELEGLDPFTPYYFTARVRGQAGATAGTCRFKFGNQTVDQSLTASPGAYVTVTPPLDANLFPYNFADSANLFSFEGVSVPVGESFQVDNIRYGPMIPFGGTWWFIDAGATQFLSGAVKKTFLFSDTLVGTDSIIQRLIHLAYGVYLPHVAAATPPTIPDPAP